MKVWSEFCFPHQILPKELPTTFYGEKVLLLKNGYVKKGLYQQFDNT